MTGASGRRVVGLSVFQNPQRLLSQIGGRPAQNPGAASTPEPPRSPLRMSADVRPGKEEYDPMTAPPESSDDDAEERPSATGFNRGLPSDSDDGPLPGDIIPTKFDKENRQPEPRRNNALRQTRRSTARRPDPAGGSQSGGPSSSAGSKRSSQQQSSSQAKPASHLVDELGFSRPAKKPKTSKPKIYAPGRHNGRTSQKSSQQSIPRSSAPQRESQFAVPLTRNLLSAGCVCVC